MNLTRMKPATYVLSAFVAGALLAACSSSGTQSATPSSGLGMNSSAVHFPSQLARTDPGRMYLGVKWRTPPAHRAYHKSFISPDAAGSPRLLFSADAGRGVVNVFRMSNQRTMDYKGAITGPQDGVSFELPQGECGDNKGNIYVADTYARKVYAFTRTGTTAFATYDTTHYGYPASCAWSNGTLAVTLYVNDGGGDGFVLLYTSASQTPTELSASNIANYYFGGYDSNGDLWVDGTDSTGHFALAGCSSSACFPISISGGTIHFPGAVQWDRVRSQWIVFDQFCNNTQSSCSYPVSGSGDLGTQTLYLASDGGLACDIVQGVIGADEGNRFVAGGDSDTCGDAESSADRWVYPTGGVPTNSTTFAIVDPSGAAISNKNK